jgi:hypothetical protein
VNLAPSVLLPAESEKKTRPYHVMLTHALILTNMGVFSLRTKAATIGWGHLNGQENGLRLPLQPLSGQNKDDVHLYLRRTTKRLPVIGFLHQQRTTVFPANHSLIYSIIHQIFFSVNTIYP